MGAIQDVWPSLLPFSKEDTTYLMQTALAARVSNRLTNPVKKGEEEEEVAQPYNSGDSLKQVILVTKPYNLKPQTVHVSVQILMDTVYQINGESKPVALFTKFDVFTMMERTKAVENGVTRHRQFWQTVHHRMTELNKSSISDLADGEQQKIARMLRDTKKATVPELKEALSLVG